MLLESYNSDEVRAKRRSSPEGSARRLASIIYPGVIGPFARNFYNRDNMIERRIQANILAGKPMQIVGFWGVGVKYWVDQYDEQLLFEYLSIKKAVEEVYQHGVEIQLILADEHGKFNGHELFGSFYDHGYFQRIESEARRLGIEPIALSDLYREWGISLPQIKDQIDESLPEYRIWQQHPKQRVQLIESAGRHSNNKMNPEVAAFYYLVMRRQEAKYLSQTFPEGLLLVNGSKDLGRILLPEDMPHMYSRVGPVWFQRDIFNFPVPF